MNDLRFGRHLARLATSLILFAVIDTSTHGQVVREIEDVTSEDVSSVAMDRAGGCNPAPAPTGGPERGLRRELSVAGGSPADLTPPSPSSLWTHETRGTTIASRPRRVS